jgi:hypothetical protein
MSESIELFSVLINWKKKNYVNVNERNMRKKSTQSTQTIQESLLFDRVSIILFLNKEDLFEEKFGQSSLKVCFDDYQETDSVEKAKEFIANKFIENGN